jgi:hypothetical protein
MNTVIVLGVTVTNINISNTSNKVEGTADNPIHGGIGRIDLSRITAFGGGQIFQDCPIPAWRILGFVVLRGLE